MWSEVLRAEVAGYLEMLDHVDIGVPLVFSRICDLRKGQEVLDLCRGDEVFDVLDQRVKR